MPKPGLESSFLGIVDAVLPSADRSPLPTCCRCSFCSSSSSTPQPAPHLSPHALGISALCPCTPQCNLQVQVSPMPLCSKPLSHLPTRLGSLENEGTFSRRGALAYFQTGPDAPKIYFCMQHQSALGLGSAASSPVGGRALFMMSSTSVQGWWSKTWPITCNPSELSLCLVITPLICTCLSVFLYVSCLDLERVACHPSLPVTPKGQPLLSSVSLGSVRGSTVQGRGGLRPSQGRSTPSDLVQEHLQA